MPTYWINRVLHMEKLERDFAAAEQRRMDREQRHAAMQNARFGGIG